MMKALSTFATSVIISMGVASAAVAATPTHNSINSTVSAQHKVHLDKALTIAQRQASGILKSVDFDYDKNSRSSKYEIELVSNDNVVYDIDIDTDSGKVLQVDKENIDRDDEKEYTALRNAKLTLPEALKRAETHVNGQAVEGEFEGDNNKPYYEIKVAKAGQEVEVKLDANSGKVLGVDQD